MTAEQLQLIEIGVPVDLQTRSLVHDQPPHPYSLLPHGERVQAGDLIQLRLATPLEVSWHWVLAPDDLVGLKINRRTKSFARKGN